MFFDFFRNSGNPTTLGPRIGILRLQVRPNPASKELASQLHRDVCSVGNSGSEQDLLPGLLSREPQTANQDGGSCLSPQPNQTALQGRPFIVPDFMIPRIVMGVYV